MPSAPAPSHPAPPQAGVGVDLGPDPELVALPAPPREERRFTSLLMVVTASAACAMMFFLRGEIRYALSPAVPVDLGDLAQATPSAALTDRYVRANGLLASVGAVRYERPMEGDSFRLAPIAGNPRVWVEIRVPEGMEGPRFAPPTSFVGRLVPMSEAGIRHARLAASVRQAGAGAVPAGAWLLVDGSSPRASRWSIALAALLTYFALWNVVGVVRLLRPKTS